MKLIAQKSFSCPVVMLSCFILLGCGKNDELATTSAAGIVQLDGQPLQDGVVTFESASTGRGASARLDADGKFAIAKIPVGDYVVTVAPVPPPDPGETAPPRLSTLGPLRLPPEKYHSPVSSGLTANFTGKPDQLITIELVVKK